MFAELLARYLVLKKWKQSPAATKGEIGVWAHWKEERDENDRSLSQAEFRRLKACLCRHAPSSFFDIFPEEKLKK
jgi:hypothetical protein